MGGQPVHKLSRWALVALVVGSMLDAGIFSLPATFGRATGVVGAVLAWIIAGSGMLMMALVFQSLANHKPELHSGIFTYARVGFGNYVGFLAALAFWAGSCVGMVSYFILVKSTLGTFFPVFGYGNNLPAVLTASAALWGLHYFVLRGVRDASILNTVTTVAKVTLVVIFLAFAVWAFDPEIFADNFWRADVSGLFVPDISHLKEYGYVGHAAEIMTPEEGKSLFFQVRHIMLVTVYVFLGIEGASVYSRYARDKKDVGFATVLGFLGVLTLFILVTMLSYGVLDRQELSVLRQPSISGVMQSITGRKGMYFVSISLIVAVLGAYLAWVMFTTEVLFTAALYKTMPSFLTRENKNGVPAIALWLTTSLVQFFLLLTLYSDYAYGAALEMTSALCLLPYLLVALYALKLAANKGSSYYRSVAVRRKNMIFALIATMYTGLMLCTSGIKYVLLPSLIYIPGSVLYFMARREQGLPVFTPGERNIFIVILILGALALFTLSAGYIAI